MRRPRSTAALRRDDRLNRTRKLSAWIAGGATAASVGLAGLLGVAIPGHAVTTTKALRPSGQTGASRGDAHGHRQRLSPPSSPPSASTSPPAVSSGGS